MPPAALPLADAWEMAWLDAEAAGGPADLPAALAWCPAPVPGTAAEALRAAGWWNGTDDLPLDVREVWYRATVARDGPHRLICEGLTPDATLWVDGEVVLDATSMFVPVERTVTLCAGGLVHIRFRSPLRRLAGMRDRPRWRPRLIAPPTLRHVRTTALGHMPGWCPSIATVGPWRPIGCVPLDDVPRLLGCRLRAMLHPDGHGTLKVEIELTRSPCRPVMMEIDGRTVALSGDGERLAATLSLAEPRRWWPHTHGEPALYPVALHLEGERYVVGSVGFRRIEVDRGSDGDGFRLIVNGVPVFCRGANWITADLAAVGQDRPATEAALALAVQAHVNMLRVPGVAAYESDAFYRRCDALGLLVWQDAAFANFDYPADDAFLAQAGAEVAAFLDRTSASPCLAVLSGGSEIAQQAAMLGVPPAEWRHPLTDSIIPDLVAAHRPDIVHVAQSPSGEGLPFLPSRGVSHYFGVGAYQRPLADARRAGVRFAAECLAFANPPEDATIDRTLGSRQTNDPRWKRGVPRDAGAAWDFEDVRDFYLRELTGLDPARLRYEDPHRYLDWSRAIVADVFEATLDEWRRPGSATAGALVWLWRDVRPGAGWGVVDSEGLPKSPWYAMRRAFRPVRLSITDEGLNGLALHLLNDTAACIDATLHLACLADGRVSLAAGERPVRIPAHGGVTVTSGDLLPSFFDVTYAYRFGPPGHDVCIATLTAADGAVLAEASYLPAGRQPATASIAWHAKPYETEAGWSLLLRADRYARHVRIRDAGFWADDAWFHMAPGRDYHVALHGDATRPPRGQVEALNAAAPAAYRAG